MASTLRPRPCPDRPCGSFPVDASVTSVEDAPLDASLLALLARLDAHPADDVLSAVVEGLALADRWKEAVERARIGIHAGAPRELVMVALAHGAVLAGRGDRAMKALDQIGAAGRRESARLRVRVLAAEGKTAEAAALAERRCVEDPGDDEMRALLRDLRGKRLTSGVDPLDTLERAERLAEKGALGRAVRVARRVAFANPADRLVRTVLADLEMQLQDEPEQTNDIVTRMPGFAAP